MRVLVTGSTGMLGHVACAVLAERFEVFGTCRGEFPSGLESFLPPGRCYAHCDGGNIDRLRKAVEDCRPAAVVNCIGVVKQKPEAQDAVQTIRINSLLPHEIAVECDRVGAKLIQISTDCVFSGTQGGYSEDSVPDATDLYGRSKLLGEVTRMPHLTLRTSIIGPQLHGQTGLLAWFVNNRTSPVRGYVNAIFSGLTTYALARIIAEIAENTPELTGLYHVASAPVTKYDLLRSVAAAAGWDVEILRFEDFYCDRSLDGRAFGKATGLVVPSWVEMIRELMGKGLTHDTSFQGQAHSHHGWNGVVGQGVDQEHSEKPRPLAEEDHHL